MPTIMSLGSLKPVIPASAYVAPGAVIIGDVVLGEYCNVWPGCVLRGDVGKIRIGARTNIQDGTIIHVTTETHDTHVADDVTVGHRVVLHGCTIAHHALIGMGSVVLDGATIEPYAMVGAGALVTQGSEIAAGMLAVGSPARVKRALSAEEKRLLDVSAEHYVELAQRYMNEAERLLADTASTQK